jgi:hypothetical protein
MAAPMWQEIRCRHRQHVALSYEARSAGRTELSALTRHPFRLTPMAVGRLTGGEQYVPP